MDLTGKNVVFLGGFGGIGQQCAKQFLSKGIKNLAILDLKESNTTLEELRNQFPNANVFFIQLDITEKDQIQAAYEDVISKIGHFDVVVNGCGIMNDSLIELSVQINLLGLIQSSLCALSHMDMAKGGRGGLIVNIASVAGLVPSGMLAVYCATKAGVVNFSLSMSDRVIYTKTGVGFITICPGITETTLFDDLKSKATLPYAEPILDRFQYVKRQSPEICAQNLVKAVEIAKNGSIWILDLGDMKEIEIPEFWKPVFEF